MDLSHSLETDKAQSGLLQEYVKLFTPIRSNPVRVLEIGILQGGSLLFWADFFSDPRSQIIGIDLQVPPREFPAKVIAYRCDQNDTKTLSRIAAEHGPFDVIIDDGSHFTRETRHCFQVLFPHLKVGGYYAVEDWGVGYWKNRDDRFKGMVEVVTNIMQRVPELSIGSFRVSLKPGQALAVFEKAPTGWAA